MVVRMPLGEGVSRIWTRQVCAAGYGLKHSILK